LCGRMTIQTGESTILIREKKSGLGLSTTEKRGKYRAVSDWEVEEKSQWDKALVFDERVKKSLPGVNIERNL